MKRDHQHTGPSGHDLAEGISSFGDYFLFVGGRQSDTFAGSAAADVAFGRRGNDHLSGLANDDDLTGGAGNDVLAGGAGMDHLVGDRGNDHLIGGDDMDNLRGGPGSDYLDEGPGHGDLEGGTGNDTLAGGLGADAFMVDPNSGHDVIKDFVAGPGMFDHLALRDISPDELLFTDTSAGVLISWNDGKGSVLLEGVFKSDLAQDDFMFTESKEVIPVGGPNGIHASAANGDSTTDGHANHTGSVRFDDINIKVGTGDNDTFLATFARDFYFGQGGNDRLFGGASDDDLRGDAGNDLLVGGDGGNHLIGGDGDDRLFGGKDSDELIGGNDADYLNAGASHDMLEGGPGNDRLDGGAGADAFMVNPESGHDTVVRGFTPGPGAFDHIAFIDISPDQVKVNDTAEGVLVSWNSGSILLEGIQKSQLAQDDFMFNNVEGGAFVSDISITSDGSAMLFPTETAASIENPENQFLIS